MMEQTLAHEQLSERGRGGGGGGGRIGRGLSATLQGMAASASHM